nr:hypothetical protein [Tanacetum cinerariifolium]
DEDDQELRLSKEARIQEEEEADELYRNININQGRGLQVTQNIKDSHVTLTLVHPDGPQESSSVSLETTFSEYRQTNPFVDAVPAILDIVHQYMTQQMTEAVREAVQIHTDRLQDSLQRENDEFLCNIDENMKKIIKGQVKSQALVEAYDADKAILDTYGESTILKRRREDDDQEGPSAGSDRGSKRQREGGEHASASTLSKTAIRKEPVQTTCHMEEPSHLVFETGADDQPIVQTSQHPEWFSQPKRPPSPDRDWNKTLRQLLKEMLNHG